MPLPDDPLNYVMFPESLWERYYGKTQLEDVTRVIERHETCVFRDGAVQLCVKRSDNGGYLVVDENGTFAGHWNCSPHGAKEMREQFIKELGLQRA